MPIKIASELCFVDALRDAALGIANEPSEEARNSTRSLLQSPYPMLVRIGIYVSGERYGNVGTVFWECLKPEWLVDIPYWHELFWFHQEGVSPILGRRARAVSHVSREGAGDWKDEARREEWDESHRRDCFMQRLVSGDAEVDSKFQSLAERRGPVREHPDFHAYSTSGWVGERSPVASDELVRMSDEELLTLMA